eukprot:g2501.t1
MNKNMMMMMIGLVVTMIGAARGSITVSQGEAFGQRAIQAMSETLAKGSMKDMAQELFAEEIEWRWAGGQNGKGSPSALVEEFGNTWGAMVSAFLPSIHHISVDTNVNKIAVAFDVTINIDGHIDGMEPCYNHLPSLFTYTVNDDMKIVLWEGHWDTGDAKTQECFAKVETKRKEL